MNEDGLLSIMETHDVLIDIQSETLASWSISPLKYQYGQIISNIHTQIKDRYITPFVFVVFAIKLKITIKASTDPAPTAQLAPIFQPNNHQVAKSPFYLNYCTEYHEKNADP